MEDPKQYSDSEIWSRLMARDEECIKWVMRRFGGALINYLERMLKNRQDAEEIFSETLQAAVLKARTYDPDRAKFSTWFYRIARNKALDFLRRKKGTVVFELLNENTDKESSSESYSDENLECNSALALFRQSFGQLTEEDKELLRLKYVANWSHREIANRFYITDGNSRVKLKRAVQRLRILMDKASVKGGEKE